MPLSALKWANAAVVLAAVSPMGRTVMSFSTLTLVDGC